MTGARDHHARFSAAQALGSSSYGAYRAERAQTEPEPRGILNGNRIHWSITDFDCCTSCDTLRSHRRVSREQT